MIIIICKQLSLQVTINTNNLHTFIWFKVFLSNANNLQERVWFQVIIHIQ